MRAARQPARRAPRPVPSYEGAGYSAAGLLGRAILDVKVFLQITAFVLAVVALRAWGPVEVQTKIDLLTAEPLARTGAAFTGAWQRATAVGRAVERTIGWGKSAGQSTAVDSF